MPRLPATAPRRRSRHREPLPPQLVPPPPPDPVEPDPDDSPRTVTRIPWAELASSPELAKLAVAGDRLTKLDIAFYSTNVKDDITLSATAAADFRQTITEYRYVSCDDGCAVGGGVPPGALALLLLGLCLLVGCARPRWR